MADKIIDQEIKEEIQKKTIVDKHHQKIKELLGNIENVGAYIEGRLKNIKRRYWTSVDIHIASIALDKDMVDDENKKVLYDAIKWSQDNWTPTKSDEYVLGRLDHDLVRLFTSRKIVVFDNHVDNMKKYMTREQLLFCTGLFKICHGWSKGEEFGTVTPSKWVAYESYRRIVNVLSPKIKNKFEARVRKCVTKLNGACNSI